MDLLKTHINNDWDAILSKEFQKEYFIILNKYVIEEYSNYIVYPRYEDIFNAFKLTPYNNVKVVILGQDPYHNPGQAEGLAFSVPEKCPTPPSLVNIFKELEQDLGIKPPRYGSLRTWAERGVLLLNTSLTVRGGQANSHQGKGWEIFTDNIIRALSLKAEPIVFILWGSNARSKRSLIDSRHHIIESAHPSPLSAYNGFFNSRPFSRANLFLKDKAINWRID